MNKLKSENLATGVIVLEWLMTLAQSIGLIVYLKYLGDHPELATEINLNHSTVLVWTSLLSVACIILFIFLSTLLTRGISQKCSRHLSIWVIIQYILFVVTFIAVVANMIGYLNLQWFWVTLIVSLAYRFFILKVISEFNQEIGLERDKERRRSIADLRSEASSVTTSPIPSKLTQNNLHFHNSQYIPLPQQQTQHYVPPEYNTRPQQQYSLQPEYIPVAQTPVSTISLSQPYHPHPAPAPYRTHGVISRSYSESTV